MKRTIEMILMTLLIVMAAAFVGSTLISCSSDDEEEVIGPGGPEDKSLTDVEKSVVGYWQLVADYDSQHMQPINDAVVAIFGKDRTLALYENGEKTLQTQFWLKQAYEPDSYFLYYDQETDYRQSTGGVTLSMKDDILTIYSYGCFSSHTSVYHRISSVSDIDREVLKYQYEEDPTTLEGTWHLTEANYSFGGMHYFNPGDITVQFTADRTLQVVNSKNTPQQRHFMPTGTYPYTVIDSYKSDNGTYTTIDIEGQGQCTYSFFSGMLCLDFGMAYDAPGYYFRKLK